jgi:hypothetical protein
MTRSLIVMAYVELILEGQRSRYNIPLSYSRKKFKLLLCCLSDGESCVQFTYCTGAIHLCQVKTCVKESSCVLENLDIMHLNNYLFKKFLYFVPFSGAFCQQGYFSLLNVWREGTFLNSSHDSIV